MSKTQSSHFNSKDTSSFIEDAISAAKEHSLEEHVPKDHLLSCASAQ